MTCFGPASATHSPGRSALSGLSVSATVALLFNPAAASIAAVALVAWLAFAPQRPADAPIAKLQPPAASLPAQANDYLLAHQGFSPRVSLLGMAPYVRTVADRADESK